MFLDGGKPYLPGPLEQKVFNAGATRSASILSILIESMPKLQLLETFRWTAFYFAKLRSIPESGARFSRPLSGLSSLRVLKIGRSGFSEMSATNCIWLMIFLPNLTHLKAHIELHLRDEKFFRDHHEVLVGESKVTHLQLKFIIRGDNETKWPRPTDTETDILEKLLSSTKGLVELKLRNLSKATYRPAMTSSLLFLRSLKSSFDSLKYLCLIGDFTEKLTGTEVGYRKRKPPVSINLKSLERISFDCLSIGTLSRPEENSRIRLNFSVLKVSHFYASPDVVEGPFSAASIEVTFMNWIKSKSFPTTVKKVILDEKPFDANGRAIDLGEKKVEWEKERIELLNLCRKKKLEVKILKEGEQLPFGVMPEPEDLM